MGSGNSRSFSTEQKEQITKRLKELYADLKAKDIDEAEIHARLSTEYKKLAESAMEETSANNQPASTVVEEKVVSKEKPVANHRHYLQPTATSQLHAGINPTKSNDETSTTTKRSTGRSTRRRSFDPDQKKFIPGRPKLVETSDMAISKSAQVLPTIPVAAPVEAAVDSWESVTTQPFCDICKMAFKSQTFLERHVKYSNLHLDNVKRLEEGDTSNICSQLPAQITEEHMMKKQEEGTHYRLLYSGSKFYWRSQDTIELDIYHHFISKAIEIIPYLAHKQKELNRIYLDYDLCTDHISPAVEEEFSTKIQTLKTESKFKAKDLDEIKLKQEIHLTKLVTYLLQRITFDPKNIGNVKTTGAEEDESKNPESATEALKQLNESIAVNDAASKNEEVCSFVALTGDNLKLFPVLEKPPVTLFPIFVNRKRRSTADEFDSEMKTMDKEVNFIKANLERANELTKANERAEKIAYFTYSAAQLMRERKYAFSNIPERFKRLWLWAIHRVLHQNRVLKMRKMLNEKGWNLVPRSPYKALRVRERSLRENHPDFGFPFSNNNSGNNMPAESELNDPLVNRIDSLVQN
jgi:hypothetical protein